MMMNGMMGGTAWGASLGTVLLLGFAYIIWVIASKENKQVKIVGQVIAIVIAVLALWILLYGGVYKGMMGKGTCGMQGGGSNMMENSGMNKWMWMQQHMKKNVK